jgi:uncharacterized protein YutE (UPF0331/DUF86 family)
MNDVINNKIITIERCQTRIKENYYSHQSEFKTNYTIQDAIMLNLIRICEASIDIGLHIIKIFKLEIPQSAKHIFEILKNHKFISNETANIMANMVGFRNIAVHEYQEINLDKVESIIEKHLDDFTVLISDILKSLKARETQS